MRSRMIKMLLYIPLLFTVQPCRRQAKHLVIWVMILVSATPLIPSVSWATRLQISTASPARHDVYDYYGEQSCTAGRSSYITGQSVYRTGLSRSGCRGGTGAQEEDPTIAGLGHMAT